MSKKIVPDPSVEDLVRIAQQDPIVETRKGKLTEMESFIDDLGLMPNNEHRVESQHIYWVYRKWCRDKKRRPQTNYKFFRELRKYFVMDKSLHGNPRYWIDPEHFQLSEQDWWDMKKFYRDSRAIRKRRKTKKDSPQSGS